MNTIPTWKKDLDALVAETNAFAARVKAQQPVSPKQVAKPVVDTALLRSDAKQGIVQADPDPPALATVEAVLAKPTAPNPLPEAPSPLPKPTTWPARLQPMMLPPFERGEIKQRLANFKAHQLRTLAERENYYSQTMTRALAMAAGLRSAKPCAE
jgi:hypothetical protein